MKILKIAQRNAANERNDFHPEAKWKIVALSTQAYLLGALKGFCHSAGGSFRSLSYNDATFFFQVLKKDQPLIVFISASEVEKIVHSSEWSKIKRFLRQNSVSFCCIGKPLCFQDITLSNSIFSQVFEEPVNVDYILQFMRTKVTSANERRVRERRAKIDRRKQFIKQVVNNNAVALRHYIKEWSLSAGVLSIDYDAMAITVNGNAVEISPKEFHLIDFLVQNLGRVVKAEEIIKVIWSNSRATKADLHQYIYMLRHKLEKNPHEPQLLVTVKGIGYKLCV